MKRICNHIQSMCGGYQSRVLSTLILADKTETYEVPHCTSDQSFVEMNGAGESV